MNARSGDDKEKKRNGGREREREREITRPLLTTIANKQNNFYRSPPQMNSQQKQLLCRVGALIPRHSRNLQG